MAVAVTFEDLANLGWRAIALLMAETAFIALLLLTSSSRPLYEEALESLTSRTVPVCANEVGSH